MFTVAFRLSIIIYHTQLNSTINRVKITDSGMQTTTFPYLNYINTGDETKTLYKKEETLLNSVLEWYNDDQSRIQLFMDIVKHKNGLSLRIIDWLITNYSKHINIVIETNGIPGDLYRDYHKNLTAHNKKNFDPFARRQRINITVFGEEERFSTIGQLNFFKWFLSKDIFSFLTENKSAIEKHMRESEKEAKKRNKFNKSKVDDMKKTVPGKRSTPKYVPQAYSGSFSLSF